MKHSSQRVQSAWAALTKMVIAICVVGLAGCTNSDVSKVKAMKLDLDPSFTIGQAFDNRKVCDSVKWDTISTPRGRKLVEYRCKLKDVKKSDLSMAPTPNPIVKVGEVFQWSVGNDGPPVLAYTGYEITYQDGQTGDQDADVDAIMKVIINNNVSTFQQYNNQYSQFKNQ